MPTPKEIAKTLLRDNGVFQPSDGLVAEVEKLLQGRERVSLGEVRLIINDFGRVKAKKVVEEKKKEDKKAKEDK